jgi:hypothetical protein
MKSDEKIEEQNAEEWLQEFLKHRKKGREFTLAEIKKYEEESYDLP